MDQLRLDVEGVVVRASAKARNWRLEVTWGEPAVLTVPRTATAAEVDAILAEKREWIERQRERHVPRLGLQRFWVSEAAARRIARECVAEAAAREAPRVGVRYERIRIGAQRTLWGSCSASGTLSFNWRLALVPQDVLEYVVVHELCHLRVPNHSQQFWRLVEHARPTWRDERDWLREHGGELLAFRPAIL